MRDDVRELAPGEWSVLALLADAPAHGWALAEGDVADGERRARLGASAGRSSTARSTCSRAVG